MPSSSIVSFSLALSIAVCISVNVFSSLADVSVVFSLADAVPMHTAKIIAIRKKPISFLLYMFNYLLKCIFNVTCLY